MTKEENRIYQKEYRRKNGAILNAKARALRKSNPQKKYFEQLKNRYGVNRDWFYAQLEKQDGRCVCGFSFSLFTGDRNLSPHVDHDHTTGRVRGLLCQQCNTAIGLLRLDEKSAEDSLILVAKLIGYLRA